MFHMFNQEYFRKPRDRRWRKLRIREAARRARSLRRPGTGRLLRGCLLAVLGLELAVGGSQAWAGSGAEIRFLHMEEEHRVEWVEPGKTEDGKQEVYGIRIKPDSLELQFYHRSQELMEPEDSDSVKQESREILPPE